MDVGKEQEVAILSQSQTILKMLGDMRNTLNSAFNRQKEEGEPTPEPPAAPSNTLDEVIDNLQEAQKQIAATHEFIVHRVIKKIL